MPYSIPSPCLFLPFPFPTINTKAAWGEEQNQGTSLYIKSFELGGLLMFIICGGPVPTLVLTTQWTSTYLKA